MWWARLLNVISGLLSGAGAPASTNSYESISTVTVGAGGASTINFTSIPSTYKHLQIRVFGLPNGSGNLTLRFNADSGANYSTHFIQGNGASASATDDFNVTYMYLLGLYTDSASYGGVSIVDVLDYQNTNKYKTVRSLSGQDGNGTGTATNWRVTFGSGSWRNTAAVNEINITAPAWRQYTQVALYGIKG